MSHEPLDLDLLIREDADEPTSEVELEAMLRRVLSATAEKEPSLRDRLRELRTWQRVLFASGAMLLFSLGFAVMMPLREDLDPSQWMRFLEAAGLMVLVSVGAVAFSLRGAHKRPLGALAWVGSGLLVGLPFLFAVAPGLWPGIPTPAQMVPMAHVMCAGMGLMGAIPAALLVVLFERSDRPPAWRLLSAAGAAGLAGYAFQNLHCPYNDPLHLVVSHAGYGVMVAAAFMMVRWVRDHLR